tara:strand:- start:117 stop:710 length:594 start_codon:yes stop_codon:yes gene_type:complete
MFSILKQKFKDFKKDLRLSFTKEKEFKDCVNSITKIIKWQIKLVDVVLERDKKSYKKNHQILINLLDSDWVYGYIISLSHAYIGQTKYKNNTRAIAISARDTLHNLDFKKNVDFGILVLEYYTKKKFDKKGTDYYLGGEIGGKDYKNFLKITDKKQNIKKILPCMELTHHLCSKMNIPTINEDEDTDGKPFYMNRKS